MATENRDQGQVVTSCFRQNQHGYATRDSYLLSKNDSLFAVEKNAVLAMPANRARQGDALNIATDRGEFVRIQSVIDSLDFLLDDRPTVEVRADVVGSSPDELHTPLKRLAVWMGPLEAGEKTVVNVDCPTAQTLA